MNKEPLISIVVPCYNSSKFIGECINSILAQTLTDFELIIIDDGSYDNTLEIVKSYNDTRIRILEKEHSGIVDSLNLGYSHANGKYIARIDSDDLMFNMRLEHQYNYMERHQYIDILSSGMEVFDSDTNEVLGLNSFSERRISLEDMKNGNVVMHPSVMIRRESLVKKMPFYYENYYNLAEDYKFFTLALLHGMFIALEPTICTRYRVHPNQSSTINKDCQHRTAERIKRALSNINNKNTDMTYIITFKNEGVEIEKTVFSLLGTVNGARIILIDDGSDDSYPYEEVAKIYYCDYVRNEVSKGVGGARDQAVSLCKTPYFTILDAHMRFYTDDWDLKFLGVLRNDSNIILSCNSTEITLKDGIYHNEEGRDLRVVGGGYGAICQIDNGFVPIYNGNICPIEGKGAIVVPAVLGAVYASSVAHWNRIGGLHGIISWGSDEPLMSIKTWLSGGKCIMLRDVYIGHLYRFKDGKKIYTTPLEDVVSNQIYLIYLFSRNDEEIKELCDSLKSKIEPSLFKKGYDVFMKRYYDCMGFKKHFFDNVAKYDLGYYRGVTNQYNKTYDMTLINRNLILTLGGFEDDYSKLLNSGYHLCHVTTDAREIECLHNAFGFELSHGYLRILECGDTEYCDRMKEHGVPYYIKCNTPSLAHTVIDKLPNMAKMPIYLSFDAEKGNLFTDEMSKLVQYGYTKFMVFDGSISKLKPYMPHEYGEDNWYGLKDAVEKINNLGSTFKLYAKLEGVEY